jgi:hypothetical protein
VHKYARGHTVIISASTAFRSVKAGRTGGALYRGRAGLDMPFGFYM